MAIVLGGTDTPTFTNYSGLQAALIDFLDARGQDRIAEFIGYAEDYLRLALDTVDREAVTTAISSPFQIPDAKRLIAVSIDGCAPLTQVSVDDALTNYSGSGDPRVFTYFADTITVYPTPEASKSYRVFYIEGLPRLSDANQTNWVVDRCPSLYLYAALIHAEAYLRDPSWITRFWEYVGGLVELLKAEAQSKRWSGTLKPQLGCVP
jgi:hypothetical protein